MKDLIIIAAMILALNIILLAVIVTEVDRPDVHKSWSSGKCVKVEYSETHSCDNLPKKYNTV